MKLISQSMAGTEQTVDYVEVVAAASTRDPGVGHHLRITIRSDSYTEQCHARIERFDGAQWHVVHYILPGAMKMGTKLGYRKDRSVASFAEDRADLLRVAGAILGADVSDRPTTKPKPTGRAAR